MRPPLPHNQQLLDFIKAHQPIGAAELFARFEGAGDNRQIFSKRLNYLKSQGWLLNKGSSTRAVWRINPDQQPGARPQAKPTAKAPTAPVWIGPIVPPRRVDVMSGPTYKPQPATYRAGAMDYARHPSHVCGEIRPFKGGM